METARVYLGVILHPLQSLSTCILNLSSQDHWSESNQVFYFQLRQLSGIYRGPRAILYMPNIYVMRLSQLVFLGCCDRLSQTGGLKQQRFTFLPFRRLKSKTKVWTALVSGKASLPSHLADGSLLAVASRGISSVHTRSWHLFFFLEGCQSSSISAPSLETHLTLDA